MQCVENGRCFNKLMLRFICAFISCLGIAYAVPSVSAQSKKELDARLKQVENLLQIDNQSSERVERQISELEFNLRKLTGEVELLRLHRDQLKAEVEALSGDIRALQDLALRMRIHLNAVDVVARETEQVKTLERARQKENAPVEEGVGALLSALPTAPIFRSVPFSLSSVSSGEPAGDHLTPEKSEKALMDDGLQKLTEGDFLGAQKIFQTYLADYPQSDQLGEVYFWLGETYYVRSNFSEAAAAYIMLLKHRPHIAMAPKALIQLAAATRSLGDTQQACNLLAGLSTYYPDASDDVKAKARRETLRSEC